MLFYVAAAAALLVAVAAAGGARADHERSTLSLAVDAALVALDADGSLAQLQEKWNGAASGSVACDHIPFPPRELAAGDSDLARVLRTGKLRVGYSVVAKFLPFFDVTDDGELTGFEAELAHAIAAVLSKQYGQHIAVAFKELSGDDGGFFPPLADALDSYAVDIVVSGSIVTAERDDDVDFTCSRSVRVDTVLLAGPGQPTDVDMATATTVACIQGTSFCGATLPEGFTFIEYASRELHDAAVINGDAAYAVGTSVTLAALIDKCAECEVTDVVLTSDQQAPMFRELNTFRTTAPYIVFEALSDATKLAAAITDGADGVSPRLAGAFVAQADAATKRAEAACGLTVLEDTCKELVGQAYAHVAAAADAEAGDKSDEDSSSGDDDDDDDDDDDSSSDDDDDDDSSSDRR